MLHLCDVQLSQTAYMMYIREVSKALLRCRYKLVAVYEMEYVSDGLLLRAHLWQLFFSVLCVLFAVSLSHLKKMPGTLRVA